jgi:hypothetical protein
MERGTLLRMMEGMGWRFRTAGLNVIWACCYGMMYERGELLRYLVMCVKRDCGQAFEVGRVGVL